MSLTTHGVCGRTWHQAGNWTSHCGGCHETFASLSLFDRHRVGDHGADRRCLNPAEMTDSGAPLAQDEHGTWYSPAARAALRAAHEREDAA